MGELLGNANFDNYIGVTTGYSEMACMGAGLLYVILTLKQVAPKYRISNMLSGVVMVSAFLLLYVQAQRGRFF